MLAKLTSKNQLTLPKAAVEAAGNSEYFEVEVRAGQLVLTPVRLQRADAVRAKLAALELGDEDLGEFAVEAAGSRLWHRIRCAKRQRCHSLLGAIVGKR